MWVFRFLHHNPVKAFKLDPRSFSGRHADFVLAHWCAEAKAGRLAPGRVYGRGDVDDVVEPEARLEPLGEGGPGEQHDHPEDEEHEDIVGIARRG